MISKIRGNVIGEPIIKDGGLKGRYMKFTIKEDNGYYVNVVVWDPKRFNVLEEARAAGELSGTLKAEAYIDKNNQPRPRLTLNIN